MRKAKQTTAKNVMVLMVQSSDHITGLAGLALTITASKDGAAFAAITPAVTDRGSGWYALALTTAHTDTLGDLALHITGAAADPADMVILVEGGATDADVSSRMATYTQPTGFLAATFPLLVSSTTNITAGTITTVTAVTGLTAANLDVAVSTRLATAGYTAPDNATISVIAGYTDSIESRLPAALVGGRMDSSVGSNLDKAGYSLTQAFPANFSSFAITAGGVVTAALATADATKLDEMYERDGLKVGAPALITPTGLTSTAITQTYTTVGTDTTVARV